MTGLRCDDIRTGIVDKVYYDKVLRGTNNTEAKGLKSTLFPSCGLPRWPWPPSLTDVLFSSYRRAVQVGSVGFNDYPQSASWNSSQ